MHWLVFIRAAPVPVPRADAPTSPQAQAGTGLADHSHWPGEPAPGPHLPWHFHAEARDTAFSPSHSAVNAKPGISTRDKRV